MKVTTLLHISLISSARCGTRCPCVCWLLAGTGATGGGGDSRHWSGSHLAICSRGRVTSITSSNHQHPASLDQDSHFNIHSILEPFSFRILYSWGFYCNSMLDIKCYIGGWTILTFLQITERDEMQTLEET